PTAPGGRGLTRGQQGHRAAGRALAEAGLTEVASAPFIGAGVFDTLRYAADDERRSAVRLMNPLSDDEPLMSTSLLQNLLPVARRNLGRGATAVAHLHHAPPTHVRTTADTSPIPS